MLNTDVKAFEGQHRVEQVLTDKGALQTDLVIMAVGIKPNTQFLEGTGIAMLKNGAIIVNRHLETSIENIYAAGDCATQFNIVKERLDIYRWVRLLISRDGWLDLICLVNLHRFVA